MQVPPFVNIENSLGPPADRGGHTMVFYNMIQNIDLKKIKSLSQTKKSKDVAETKQRSMLYIQDDKTNNLYKLPTEDCSKLLTEKITKVDKKITSSVINAINRPQDLKLEDRIKPYR